MKMSLSGYDFEFSKLHKCIFVRQHICDAEGVVQAVTDILDVIELGADIDKFEFEHQVNEWLKNR